MPRSLGGRRAGLIVADSVDPDYLHGSPQSQCEPAFHRDRACRSYVRPCLSGRCRGSTAASCIACLGPAPPVPASVWRRACDKGGCRGPFRKTPMHSDLRCPRPGRPLGRVIRPGRWNAACRSCVVLYMEPINEVHVAEPGLAVIDVAAADAATALALQEVLAAQWATATADHVTHEPGEPGVRLRCYLDLRQPLRTVSPSGP
ncbi:DUF6207 family protein [Streptomyces lanatus]|uniref:DUF6207 family protein n=2 Tax=Streptomyces lanatus TaxID=66900 RepID=A0ABV1Y897_9ACTN